MNFINDILDPIGIVIGLAVAIPIFHTWWDLVIGKQRRFKTWGKKARKNTGEIKSILIVDITSKKNIKNEVIRFASNSDYLDKIPDDHIEYIGREKDLSPDNIVGLVQDIRHSIANIAGRGTEELYIFIAGPLIVSALVGAELKNANCKVHFMQNDRVQNTYIDYGTVNYPML